MIARRPRVLCLDAEGGHGGSSRSLFEALKHVDRDFIDVEVWCRREGPIKERYREIGIHCRVERQMPHFSALPRLSRNIALFSAACWHFHRSLAFRKKLHAQVADGFDLVHFNLETLFMLAVWLRSRTELPLTMHMRTMLVDTAFSRLQMRKISNALDRLIFITENECKHFETLGGCVDNTAIIYNCVELTPEKTFGGTSEFRIACLSNYDWVRGVDRLIDVAQSLQSLGRSDIIFVVAGDMGLRRSLPGELGQLGGEGATLADYAQLKNVASMFRFLGHVSDPERVLSECDAMIKPTREANPWGRDILEGLAAGKPVISYGTYDTFVETGETGILREVFDADETAQDIIGLADDPAYCQALGSGGRSRVAQLCDGPTQAAKLVQVWRSAIAAN